MRNVEQTISIALSFLSFLLDNIFCVFFFDRRKVVNENRQKKTNSEFLKLQKLQKSKNEVI
jgi:hypothetical protein